MNRSQKSAMGVDIFRKLQLVLGNKQDDLLSKISPNLIELLQHVSLSSKRYSTFAFSQSKKIFQLTTAAADYKNDCNSFAKRN